MVERKYTIALNFSFRKIKLSKKASAFLSGKLQISTSGRTEAGGLMLPWEGVMLKNAKIT